jgi:hypothetical protein
MRIEQCQRLLGVLACQLLLSFCHVGIRQVAVRIGRFRIGDDDQLENLGSRPAISHNLGLMCRQTVRGTAILQRALSYLLDSLTIAGGAVATRT